MGGRTLVLGDIHGNYKALIQVLERSNFDYDKDTLIQLGDIVDGYPESYECIEELLKITNLISIVGNHDNVFLEFINSNKNPFGWRRGGTATLYSYCKNLDMDCQITYDKIFTNLVNNDIPSTHKRFFQNQKLYYIDSLNRLFVHGGFNKKHTIEWHEEHDHETLYWDRLLWRQALSAGKTKLKTEDNFNEIYIGHTTTMNWGKTVPMFAGGVINIDTGAGYDGVLSLIDINNKDLWQSDPSKELYPDWKHSR